MASLSVVPFSPKPPRAGWSASSCRNVPQFSSNLLGERLYSQGFRIKKCSSLKKKGKWPLAPQVTARLFGPAMFESSKLRVLLLTKEGTKDSKSHHLRAWEEQERPRVYTLTHSDFTAQLTLSIAREINSGQLRGWYRRLQRDEVLAEWRKTQGVMSLHVHCHISGGDRNFFHILIAKLRFHIFRKELPIVLEAIMVGDEELFRRHPELAVAAVWIYFHSNWLEYDGVECWGPLAEAIHHDPARGRQHYPELPSARCDTPCDCCSRYVSVVPVPESLRSLLHQNRSL